MKELKEEVIEFAKAFGKMWATANYVTGKCVAYNEIFNKHQYLLGLDKILETAIINIGTNEDNKYSDEFMHDYFSIHFPIDKVKCNEINFSDIDITLIKIIKNDYTDYLCNKYGNKLLTILK